MTQNPEKSEEPKNEHSEKEYGDDFSELEFDDASN
jgi:hypothetical protein